ncbi:MAG TPA: DUF6055 domain-containing protein, partial [Blastocatellia bacterium]|nr:DUF6055 domain-containing protein [Blastocatellia bacterium]
MKKILVLVVPLLIGVLLLSLLFSLEQRGSTASEPEILPLFPVKSPDRLSFVGHANSTDGAEPALRTPSGAIWNREPLAVAAGFTSAFRFRINDQAALEKQAGGLSFAIQNAGLTAIAETDCRLGRSVLPNSVVIELNPFERRPACDGADLQARGLGINLNHSLPGEPAAPNENYSLGRLGPDSVPSLNDGRSHLILVEYSPGLLNVYLDDLNAPLLKARVDLALELRLTEGRAWLGFTSDEAASQNLEILEWWYWRMSDAAGLDRRMIISGATVEEPARENIFGPIPTPSPAMPAGYCPGLANGPENGTYQVLNPGSSATIYSSAHFAARWNASNNVPLTEAQAQEGLNTLEQLWTKYIAELGFPRPYDTDAVKYKVDVNVSDQGWASGGGTGAGHPAMWLHYNAFRDPGALAHEFTHTLQFSSRGMRDSVYTGWSWESHAEWMRHQFFRDQVNCAELLVNYPHLYYGSTRDRYCNWQFWEFIKDKYCYRIVTDIWALSK